MDDRIALFGIGLDPLDMTQAIERLLSWIAAPGYASRYVVTPNVDHIVKLRHDRVFHEAYKDADMVLVDGKPVLLAARLLGAALPGTVPGSDLLPALFAASERHGGVSVFLLGAAEGVAERAAEIIRRTWPWVRVIGVYSPPMGFSADSPATEVALERIRAVAPDVLAVGLGAPRQEIWVHKVRSRIHAKTILCIGATIDFMAGEKPRAPLWMRRAGMEWLHRMVTEPRRMVIRYGHDAMVFPGLVMIEWIRRRRKAV